MAEIIQRLQAAKKRLHEYDNQKIRYFHETAGEVLEKTWKPRVLDIVGGSLIFVTILAYAIAVYRVGWKASFHRPYIWGVTAMICGVLLVIIEEVARNEFVGGWNKSGTN